MAPFQMSNQLKPTTAILEKDQKEILEDWLREQLSAQMWRPDLMTEAELRQQSSEFLSLFTTGLRTGSSDDISGPAWDALRDMLADISRTRALQGFTPVETASFVFSLKQPLFARLRHALKDDPQALTDEFWLTTTLLDKLGLYTTEVLQKSREDVIRRQ